VSNGPVSGNGIAIGIPAGTVFWTATSQAAWSQFVQLRDSAGNVLFTAEGASPDGHSPTQIGQGFFQAGDESGNYSVWLGVDGGQRWSSVLWAQDSIAASGTDYLGKYVFGTEDGSDNDYNDTYLQLQWFEYLG